MTLKLSANPLLNSQAVQAVPLDDIAAPCILGRSKREARRILKDLRRKQTAAQAIAGLTQENEIYGFTKGQFSLLDLLEACLQLTGPCRLTVSTWTAARHEIIELARHQKTGLILSTRWLVDFTFARRDPEAANQIRETFGADSMRIAQNHSKFAIFENDAWRLCVRSSMNLNMNPRFEDFTIAHDPALADFLNAILNDIWRKQPLSLANARPAEIKAFFADEM